MRLTLIPLVLLCACVDPGYRFGDPLSNPFTGAGPLVGDSAYAQRRGQVELVVKSNFDQIRTDIQSGGGPALTQAMDAAGIPAGDRPARIIQLQSDLGLYDNAPGALVTALVVYGG